MTYSKQFSDGSLPLAAVDPGPKKSAIQLFSFSFLSWSTVAFIRFLGGSVL